MIYSIHLLLLFGRKTYPWNEAHLTRNEDHSISLDGLGVRTDSPWSVLGAHYLSGTRRNAHHTTNGR